MREIKQNDRIELSLPANRELMLVVRLATSGVVARAGLTIDVLDDVKMAVEEACMFMMTQASVPERLQLAFGLGERAIEVRIACEDNVSCGSNVPCGDNVSCVGCEPCAEADSADPDAELEVVRCILESLVDQVEICRTGGIVGSICLKAGAWE